MTDKGNQYLIIFTLCLLVFAASSQVMIIAPLLPQIGIELQTSKKVLGYLITVYAIALGLSAIVIGPLSDKIGRRKILLLGSSAMTLFLLAHSIANSFISLLIIRTATGFSAGVLSGAAVSYVGDYFPYEKRGWASGWIMSGIAMGQILGIPLGTFLAEGYGFKFPFILFGIFMGITFLLVLFFVPQPNVILQKKKLTLRNSVKKYRDLLKKPDISAVALSYLLMFLSLSIYVIYLPLWLDQKFNVSSTNIGWLFCAGGVINAISGPRAGKLSDQIGRKKMIISSCIGLAIFMVMTTYLLVDFWVAYLIFPIVMLLIAIRISPFQALSSELVNSNNRGSLMSLLVAIGNIGSGFAGVLGGYLFEYTGYLSNTIFGGISIIITAYLVWKYVPEPELKSSI